MNIRKVDGLYLMVSYLLLSMIKILGLSSK